MIDRIREDEFFERLAAATESLEEVKSSAPSPLKAKIYSALTRRQAASGPLLSVLETKASGRGLCIFEEALGILPGPKSVKSFNACSVCHARVLAERFKKAPIYWPNCPYVDFQKS